MLLVLMINGLISLLCWMVVIKLLSCRTKIITTTALLDQAAIVGEQLRFVPLALAERQLQVLQLQQIYQQRSIQLNQVQQLIQLIIWLDLMAVD